MTSTTFFHELKETYRWVLKRNRGILILLTVLMFLAGPLILLVIAPGWNNLPEINGFTEAEKLARIQANFTSFLSYAIVAAMVAILVFSAVLCVMLFGYMHNKRSVDLFHSLPVRREALLLGRWCAGLTILFIPLLLNFLILWIVPTAYGASVNGWTVFSPMLWTMLMGTAAFTSCMLMAVCSGTMLDTALSVIGINAGYPFLILCAFAIINNLLPGANVDYGHHVFILSALAPFAAWVVPIMGWGSSSPWFLLWWILLTLVMLCGAVALYKKRKSESAENSLAFPLPKILIRFLLTAVGGMGFGLILNSNGGPINFFIGLAAGSLIAHTVVECIYSRGFKHLKKSFEWYGVFAVAFVLFYGILATGCFGYDTRIPAADEVESVVINDDLYNGFNGGSGCSAIFNENNNYIKNLSPILMEPESIQSVLEAQKKLIELRREQGFPYQMGNNTMGGTLTLRYQLKNGRSMTRFYFQYNSHTDNGKAFGEAAQTITDRKEYTEGLDMVFLLEPQNIKNIVLKAPGSESSTGKAAAPEDAQKKELLDALRQDLLNKKINYNPDSKNTLLLTMELDFYNNITPKNNKLQTLLGDYKGKINLPGGGEYNIYDKSSAVYELLKKYGWA